MKAVILAWWPRYAIMQRNLYKAKGHGGNWRESDSLYEINSSSSVCIARGSFGALGMLN